MTGSITATPAPAGTATARSRLSRLSRAACRASPLLGVAVGATSSFLQGWMTAPWTTLANSASSWLLPAFVVGLLQRRVGTAALLGGLTCLGEVAGYYGVSAARGYGVSMTWVAFWTVCAIVGGPVFGAGGRLARGAASRAAVSLGAAAPAATFLGEGVGSYWLRLGYRPGAVLFVALGLVAAALALALAPGRPRTLAIIVLGALSAAFGYGFALRPVV